MTTHSTPEASVIELCHEVHGDARDDALPLLLIHGGGSTIATCWGKILPSLTAVRQVIAIELQGHGHTPSPPERPYTFENSADDVAAVLERLGMPRVDVMGFSNGGNVAMRHPARVGRQVVAAAFYLRAGMIDGFWDGLHAASVSEMPAVYREADRAINPDPDHQQLLFELDTEAMLGFVDWNADDLRAMTTPTLFVAGDRDVVRVEHTVEMSALAPRARTLILPAGHGDYVGEVLASGEDRTAMEATLPWLLSFLDGAIDAE